MIGTFLSSESGLSSGGTIGGDLTIDGDITVNGSGGYAYSEVLTGDMKITNTGSGVSLEVTGANALLLSTVTNDAATPTLAFGDGDTGFYESSDDLLTIAVGGTARWAMADVGGERFGGTGSGGGVLLATGGSSTYASHTFTADFDTGMRRASADVLALHAGGERMILDVNSRISLSNNDSGTDNTVFGFLAGAAGLSGGINNVLIGDYAGNALTSGDNNVAIGKDALLVEDTGSQNVAIGFESLKAMNYDGPGENTCVGYRSGLSITGGTANVCIGQGAGDGFNTESENTFVGYNAGGGAINGAEQCVAIGSQALLGSATGDGTIAIGWKSLTALTSGAGNIAIGFKASLGVTTGVANLAIGYQALQHTDTGDYNIAIGYNVMSDLDDAGATKDCNNNIGIGYNAMSGTWGSTKSEHNLAIGSSAMSGAMNGANENTALGTTAGNLITSGSSNTLVGYEADVDAATDSYQTRVGHYGALRYMTARLDMSGDAQGSFTNAGTDNRPATASLLKIPQYGFLKRVTCTVVTASGGTGVYNISVADNNVAAGTALTGRKELIGATATADSNFVGATFRQSTLSADGDTQVDIVTAKFVHIWEADQATDDSNGWTFMEGQAMYLYVCHSGTGNAENAQDAVLRITAEFWGED